MKTYTPRQISLKRLLVLYESDTCILKLPRKRLSYGILAVKNQILRVNPKANLEKITMVEIIKANKYEKERYARIQAELKAKRAKQNQETKYIYKQITGIFEKNVYTLTEIWKCNMLFDPITAKPYHSKRYILERVDRIPTIYRSYDIETREQSLTWEMVFNLNKESLTKYAEMSELTTVPRPMWKMPPFRRLTKRAKTPKEKKKSRKRYALPEKMRPPLPEKNPKTPEEIARGEEEERVIHRENRNEWLPNSYKTL